MGGLGWIALVNIEEGVLVPVVGATSKGGVGVRKPVKLNLDKVVNKEASLNAPNKD